MNTNAFAVISSSEIFIFPECSREASIINCNESMGFSPVKQQ